MGITFLQRILGECKIVERCSEKKWWHWPWPSRALLFILECPQGCSAEQYKSSIDASPPMIESSNKVDLKIVDVARRDPTSPTSTERALLPTPRAVQPLSIPTPRNPPTFEPEEAVQPKELELVPRRRPPPPQVYPFIGR